MGNETDVTTKLKELNCDPLQLSARIALGKDITLPHPMYDKIKRKWIEVLKKLKEDEIDLLSLTEFWNMLDKALKASPPTQEVRSKHILNLTKFVAPTLSSVSQDVNPENIADALKELAGQLPE